MFVSLNIVNWVLKLHSSFSGICHGFKGEKKSLWTMLQTEMQIEFNAFLGYYDNIKVDKKREWIKNTKW